MDAATAGLRAVTMLPRKRRGEFVAALGQYICGVHRRALNVHDQSVPGNARTRRRGGFIARLNELPAGILEQRREIPHQLVKRQSA
jgi:hypothetical protein